MRMLTVSLLLCAVVALTAGTACPAAWTLGGCNRCYRCWPGKVAWADAERHCVSEGGNLASIHSKAEHTFILGLVRKATGRDAKTWVGGYDAMKEGVWFWSDGTKFDYTEWSKGNPDNSSGRQHCLAINWSKQRWDDEFCTTKMPFCCSKDL